MRLAPDWLSWPETQTLIQAFAPKGDALRFVGGSVRDALLSRNVTDVDAATTLNPDAVMVLLKNANIKALPTGIDHGTVTAFIDGKSFEITTLRRDVITDGRHAQVSYTDDWKEDATRRDFTMNALYLSPAGELFDYSTGMDDAKAGHVRFIGDPKERIREDYLRILRFFRFHAHYGKNDPDKAALAACRELAEGLKNISGERIQVEMMKLLAAPRSCPTLECMQEAHILDYAFGFQIKTLGLVKHLEQRIPDAPPVVKLAALIETPDECAVVQQHMKLSNETASRLRKLVSEHGKIRSDLSPPGQKKLLRMFGQELFTQLVWLSIARDQHPAFASMLLLAGEWTPPPFPVSGEDLKKRGMAEGKDLGEALRRLEEKWEQSDYALSKEQLLTNL